MTDGTEAPSPISPAPDGRPDADPPLDDPYLLHPLPARRGVSRLAVSSLVAAPLGPVGAILAIVFGWHARHEIEHEAALDAAAGGGRALAPRRPGHGLATVGIVLGVLLTMMWGGGLSYWAWTFRYRSDPAGDEPGSTAATAATAAGAVPPAPPAVVDRPPRADKGPSAPKYTRVHQEGGITVVDVGITTQSLFDELAKQRAEATAAGETMVVMTTQGDCKPCRGVDRSLPDPLMQTALAHARLVRVDVVVFDVDLDALKMDHDGVPGFFLLSPDLTPRDGLDGGEWDDDIPVNIAPVLGAFVRGKYGRRRKPWRAVPASGMAL